MLSYRNKHKAHFRQKNLERHIVDQGVASLAKEARLTHEKAALKVERRHQHAVNKAMKLARKIRNLEEALANHKAKGYAEQYGGAYYHGYARHMPLRYENNAFDLAMRRMHLSRSEMLLIINNPDMFPKPELVFDLWNGNYYITWEGK